MPYDFVQEDEKGKSYIDVLDVRLEEASVPGNQPLDASKPFGEVSGTAKRIFVTKGIESDYYVEITGKGIKEGMSVITPIVQKEDSSAGNMMGGRGKMGGF